MFIGIYAQTIKCYLINGQSHLPKSRFGQSIRKTRANKTDFSQWSSHLPVYDLYIWKEYHGHIEITILNHLVFWHIFGVFFCFSVDLFLTTGQKYATIPWKDSFRRCHALDDWYIFWYLPTTALEFSKYILTDENRPVCILVFIWKLY